jgi:hypothetical protein
MLANKTLQSINNTQICKILTSSVLTVLGNKQGNFLPLHPIIQKNFKQLVSFSELLKGNPHIDLLLNCYNKIQVPSFNTTYPVLEKLIKAKQNDKAQKLIYRINVNDLKPFQQINYAIILAQLDDIRGAKTIVKEAYKQDNNLKNGYARIGWLVYCPKKQYQKAIELFELDNKAGSLSPDYLQNYALICALAGKLIKSKKLIKKSYIYSPLLLDGYAKIGWNFFHYNKNYHQALLLMEKDYNLSRISDEYLQKYSIILSTIGQEQKAFSIINNIYQKDKSAQNAYTLIANTVFWPSHYYYKALNAMSIDSKALRLSPTCQLTYAQKLAQLGELKSAKHIIHKLYSEDKKCNDGYSLIAWNYYAKREKLEQALVFFKMDIKRNRISPMQLCNMGLIYGELNNLSSATKMVDQAYTKSSHLLNGYDAFTWHFIHQLDLEKAHYFYNLSLTKDCHKDRFKVVKAIMCILESSDYNKARQSLINITEKKLVSDWLIALIHLHEARVLKQINYKVCEEIMLEHATTNLKSEIFYNRLAQLYATQGNITMCKKICEKAKKLFPASQQVTTGALLRLLLNGHRKAVQTCVENLDIKIISSPPELITSAFIMLATGESKKAESCIQKLHSHDTYFFRGQPWNSILFYFWSGIAKVYCSPSVSAKCLDLAKKYYPMYQIRKSLLNSETFNNKYSNIKLPTFHYPWNEKPISFTV